MKATSIGHAGILVETGTRTIVCDPWFVPAFWASWFVFPRNDQLPPDVMAKLERPDYLYISHQHGDHLDEAWLTNHIDKSTPVLLPDFATRELERQLNRLGFTNFVLTRNGEMTDLGEGLRFSINV
jgi:UDP-MurNAc hydroxylase